MMTVIFEPVAQNTIIRPMAQAVSLARGGKTVPYVDTADKKKKVVDEKDLAWLNLTTEIKGHQVPVKSDLVTFRAKHCPVQVLVLVNDVTVKVTSKTTVQQAMDQFYRKFRVQNHIAKAALLNRQRDYS